MNARVPTLERWHRATSSCGKDLTVSDVKLLAHWDGWCDPCGTERPLALTERGARGVRAWLSGVGIADRSLSLTCRLCGQCQPVPQFEQDDEPEVTEIAASAVPLILAATPLPGGRSIVVASAARAPEPAAKPVSPPAPRAYRSPVRSASVTDTALLSLLAEGLDVVGAGQP